MKNAIERLKENPVTCFFILSFLISWILWIPLLYGHFRYGWTNWEGNSWTNHRTQLGILGALGPAISAIIMIYLLDGKNGIKTLLKRAIQWKANILWWVAGFYFWWIVCSVLVFTLNLKPAQEISMGLVYALINIPGLLIIQLPFLIGMFGEELGWRGFALPKLLDKYNPVIASLILALPWIFWHTPLAVFQEWRGNLPIGHFLLNYIATVIPLTLIFTWFFQKTKGSVLLTIIFHSSLNLTFNAYTSALGLEESTGNVLREYRMIVLWTLAIIIAIYYWFLQRKIASQKK